MTMQTVVPPAAFANGVTRLEPAVTEAATIGFYLIYASIAVGLVVFLARVLSRNGQIFLEEAFEREDLAASINQLLVIGFYLLNMGYAFLVYRMQASYPSVIEAFNDLMTNLGVLLVSLGVLHLLNMAVLWRIGGRVLRARRPSQPTPPSPSWNQPLAGATSRYPDYDLGVDGDLGPDAAPGAGADGLG